VALLATALLALLMLRDRSAGSPEAARPAAEAQHFTDPLTHLATRLGIERQLAAAVIDCDKNNGRLAVLIFDLDGFKPVNSSFGHQVGDLLLRQVADRLRARLGPQDLAGRIGGDGFVILIAQAGNKEALAEFATLLLQDLSRPYLVDGRELAISCSVGIAQYPDDGGQTRLLARADAAKNAAKRLGGACLCFYMPGMDGDAREQMDLLRDLRHAIERRELELFYQPKIDATSGEVTAAEALLRWRHPVRGLVSPTVFIPIAERFGFMRDLGNWVIEDACRQALVWRENGLRMRMAINLSAQQMRQADIVDRIRSALAQNRIQPSLLTCEITESVAMEDTQATQETFRRLGELGVHLSIDDFGTGYSSLSYLRQLPAAELKIDRAFITDIASSRDARAVVDAVVKLAHALGLRVVAEGVETQAQQQILSTMGCDEFQGYLFARPMSAQAILLWATDDKNSAPAFRASLFGDTLQSDSF
jgi:diguanylate cyclase